MSVLPMISKLVNPIKQQLKKPTLSVLSLGIVAATFTLLKAEPASAYCVINQSGETITALQLPLKGDSFKAVIEPGKSSCCNWNDTSCISSNGRYGETSFLLYKGALDIDSITKEETFKEIIETATGGIAEKIFEKLEQEGYASKDQSLGEVTTYNGGVVWYDGGTEAVGCWIGPCQGQDVNNDGSRGHKPDDKDK